MLFLEHSLTALARGVSLPFCSSHASTVMGENKWETWEEALACDQKLWVNSPHPLPQEVGERGGLFYPDDLNVSG